MATPPSSPPKDTKHSTRFSRVLSAKIVQPFRRLVTRNPKVEKQSGHSAALVSGEWIFVSSCSGHDPITREISPLVEEQAEQCFLNIEAALKEAGAQMADVVRVRYVLKDAKEWRDCWPVLRKWLGAVRPASSVIQAGLVDDVMRIEVEVTARKTGERNFAGGI